MFLRTNHSLYRINQNG